MSSKKCKNDNGETSVGYYKGNEPSPKGLGYCARYENEGSIRKGNDGNLWKVTNGRWVKGGPALVSDLKNKRKSTAKKSATKRKPAKSKKSAKKSVKKPAKKSVIKSAKKSVKKKSVKKSAKKSAKKSTKKPAKKSAKKLDCRFKINKSKK